MGVHDDQDLVADLLPGAAAAAHCRQGPADPHAATRMRLPQFGHAAGDLVRSAREHPWLCARVPLPRQDALEGEALPHEDPAPEALLAGLDVRLLRDLEDGQGRHARPDRLARVDMHQRVPRAHLPHVHALGLFLPRVHELEAVLVPPLQGHVLPRHLLLHDLVRDLRPFSLPAAHGGEPRVGVAPAPRLDPLVPGGGLQDEADACDGRLDDILAAGVSLLQGRRHREAEPLQAIVTDSLHLHLASLLVDGCHALGPLHHFLLERRDPLARHSRGEHAEVQGALAKARLQEGADLDLGPSAIVGRHAGHVHVAAVPLELEGGEGDVGAHFAFPPGGDEGGALGLRLRLRGLEAALLLLLQAVPLGVARELEAEVDVTVLDPTVASAFVQHEHEVRLDLPGRDLDERLLGVHVDGRQRNPL
mmetsp:Transcript_22052/g.63065  ORF Transcript_22052/g.63065 Transcript_22052/m.63065 type:complete len:420 (-) Transcript_22052:1155-2414(-)